MTDTSDKYWKSVHQEYPKVFSRAIDNNKQLENEQAKTNYYGEQLSPLFDKAFRRLTGNSEDSEFMKDVFCFPRCQTIINHRELRAREVVSAASAEATPPPPPQLGKGEGDIRRKRLDEYFNSLIKKAKNTTSNGNTESVEKVIFWVGEKGSGKTTLMNHFITQKETNLKNAKVILIRLNVFQRKKPRTLPNIQKMLYEKIFKVLQAHYPNIESYESYGAQCLIWKDRLSSLPNRDDVEHVNEKIRRWQENTIDYGRRVVSYLHGKEWAFIFVLDNIDQHYDKKLTGEVINFGVALAADPVKSLVIIVCRVDTIHEQLPCIQDVYQNIEQPWLHVPPPDFNRVFLKRLDYLENNMKSEMPIVGNEDGRPIREVISEGLLAKHIAKYFLAPDPVTKINYLITSLANGNMRDMFSMIITILKTHITDVTDVATLQIAKECEKIRQKKAISFDPEFDTNIRNHLIVWALMLKNNYKYYMDGNQRTWIQNVYDIHDRKHSYWLKLLILEYFIFVAEEDEHSLAGVANKVHVPEEELGVIFIDEMDFAQEELTIALNALTNNVNTSPLLWKENKKYGHKIENEYSITATGVLFARYVWKLFVYLELMIESLLLPNTHNSRSLGIKLIPYEPLIEKSDRDKLYLTRSFFLGKLKHVQQVLEFFEKDELLDSSHHNMFKSTSTKFERRFFPELKESINLQAAIIGKSLGITVDY